MRSGFRQINAAVCAVCDSTEWKVTISVDDDGVYHGELFGECLQCGSDVGDPVHEFQSGLKADKP